MKTIYKYPVEPNSEHGHWREISIRVPRLAVPLCVQNQRGQVCIWAEVDTDLPDEEFEVLRFACIGTGHGAVPPNGTYFGTVIDGPYVWHFYRL